MLKVYNCVLNEHDLALVALAAVICTIASFTAVTLLHHVQRSAGWIRNVWIAVSGTASGFGIWATHFVAMLAFSPGIPSGYNIALTFLSLVAAVVLTGAGSAVALITTSRACRWLGGAIVGGGIAAMHYTGMAAFEVEGWILWDPTLVATSIALGAVIGALALDVALQKPSFRGKAYGALLLTLAICSHHFTAMGAVSIVPDATLQVSRTALPVGLLAVAVAVASFAIVLLAFAGLAVDIRDRRQAARGAYALRGLADAAVEGLIICDSNVVVSGNNSFAELSGYGREEIIGTPVSGLFQEDGFSAQLAAQRDQPLEAELVHADGSRIAVEVIQRPVELGGKTHDAIAVRDIRSRKIAERRINFLAQHDPLTELPNRSHFEKRLDREIKVALQTGVPLAVLCFDLDRFKEVNDLFGHAAGDAMLRALAARVAGLLDETQMLARLGGDEFAITAPGLSDPAVAGRLAENILEALRQESETCSFRHLVSASIGIAICPTDATDRQALLGHADTALYRAKQEGRGTYRFFEAEMGAQVRDRRQIEHDLRQAVDRGELRLVYQPQANIMSGEIVGFEALLRWRHPTRGEVSPDVFIPIAEEGGSILKIGEWVLQQACREAASWTRPLSIAVNVSPVQIHNGNFARQLHQILLETGLAPRRLEIEITETALVRDLNRALACLRQIKLLGVRIAMDDFGTGYSSLSNLRAFPFDKIKIDRSFVKSVDSNGQAAAIVRAVLGLGQGLGLPVLAEGVETAGQFKFLAGESCAEAQGYHVGRPVDISAFRHIAHGGARKADKVA